MSVIEEEGVFFFFCSRGSLTPVAAPNVFLAGDRLRKSGFEAIVLRDGAWRPSVETGASVPGYSGGLAACAVVSGPRVVARVSGCHSDMSNAVDLVRSRYFRVAYGAATGHKTADPIGPSFWRLEGVIFPSSFQPQPHHHHG